MGKPAMSEWTFVWYLKLECDDINVRYGGTNHSQQPEFKWLPVIQSAPEGDCCQRMRKCRCHISSSRSAGRPFKGFDFIADDEQRDQPKSAKRTIDQLVKERDAADGTCDKGQRKNQDAT